MDEAHAITNDGQEIHNLQVDMQKACQHVHLQSEESEMWDPFCLEP